MCYAGGKDQLPKIALFAGRDISRLEQLSLTPSYLLRLSLLETSGVNAITTTGGPGTNSSAGSVGENSAHQTSTVPPGSGDPIGAASSHDATQVLLPVLVDYRYEDRKES
jgi:hypothetical protein